MKPFGDDYVFMGHAFPNRPRIFLKYDGHNQKQALTAQAKKAGAKILNHHPVLDLLRNADGITGALAPGHERKGAILCRRPREKGHPRHWCGLTALSSGRNTGVAVQYGFLSVLHGRGAGPGLAYRRETGEHGTAQPSCRAEIFFQGGQEYMDRCVPVSQRQAARTLCHPATREVGDITCDVWNSAYTDVVMNGTGPAYIDCSGTSRTT